MDVKKCELCNSPARVHCESDQASLCWDCDANVHSANFLVANHSRVLLCHVCQSPTSWIGSGPKHVPTISACENCAGENGIDNDEENDDEAEAESGNHIRNYQENQVVPLSLDPTPPVSSSSNADEAEAESGNHIPNDEENQVVPLSLDPTQPVSSSSNDSACSKTSSNGEDV